MIPSKRQVLPDPSYQYQTGQSDKAEPCSDDQTYARLSISGTTLRNRKDRSAEKAVKDWNIDVQQPTVSAFPTEKELSLEERKQQAEELTQLRTFRDAISILNKRDFNYLRIAARHGFFDIIKYLVEDQKKEVYKQSEYAPIWEAVNSGHLKIVDYLTDNGLDKNNTYYVNCDVYGLDNLITAVASSDQMDTNSEIEMIELLLAKGEPVDGYGLITPAFVANSKNKLELVNFFQKHGAKPEGLKKLDCDKVEKIYGIAIPQEIRDFNIENLEVRQIFEFLSKFYPERNPFGEFEEFEIQRDASTLPRLISCPSIRKAKSAASNTSASE